MSNFPERLEKLYMDIAPNVGYVGAIDEAADYIRDLEKSLKEFMEFQISDYHRSADMAKRYCEIRRDARKVLEK